ncbi:MAG: putative ABC transporter substrate binding protein [Chloroflexi bacterium]|nr:MAG: putative ABC transporter substrate binding protein [Chloroflexota bacterium]
MTKNPVPTLVLIMFVLTTVLSGCASNSTAITSEGDFRPLQVSAPDCNYNGEIKSVEAVDQFTVRFSLCQPDVAFPAKIAAPIFAIQDQGVLDSLKGDSTAMSESPIGTGAYQLKEWNRGGNIILEPSSSYWGVPPLSPTLDFKWQSDPTKLYGLTSMASVAGIDRPPSAIVPNMLINANLKVLTHTPSMNLYYLGFNNTIPPFDKLEVRKAFAIVLDREKLLRGAFPEGSELAQQMVPSNVQSGRSIEQKWYESKPKDAEDILKSIGFDFGQEITLAVMNSQMQYLDSPAYVAGEVKKQLAQINVKITIKAMTPEEFTQSIKDGKEMLYFYWFQADYEDGAAFFERPFIRESGLLGNPYVEIQQKIKDVLSIYDPEARQEIFDQLNLMIKDQVPLVPLGHAANIIIFRRSVKNAATNAFYENFEDMIGANNTIQFVGVVEPGSLYPADEDDYSIFRITRLLYDTLLTSGFGGVPTRPLLAESWSSNADLTEWTFLLRYNVKFSNEATFDANDVVATFAAIWDASNPNHKGRTSDFALYKRLFGNLLNAE